MSSHQQDEYVAEGYYTANRTTYPTNDSSASHSGMFEDFLFIFRVNWLFPVAEVMQNKAKFNFGSIARFIFRSYGYKTTTKMKSLESGNSNFGNFPWNLSLIHFNGLYFLCFDLECKHFFGFSPELLSY